MSDRVGRRQVLSLFGAASLARWLPGCDQLVVLDPDGHGDSIDPITPNADFYVYRYAAQPELDPDEHETVIAHGDVELARFDLAALESLGARPKEHTLECIGARPTIQNIGNAVWEGVPLVELLEALGVEIPASAVGLRLVGMDDYHAGLPIADLVDGPVWIVWRMNGEPLPAEHGAPARLLVPGRYGVKNLKWLREIAFVDEPHESYWTSKGWSEGASYLPNTFVVSPIEGFRLSAALPTKFVGTAFAGADPVVGVEYRIDRGPWRDAELDYASEAPDTWVLWAFSWTPEAGEYTVQVRCRTASGAHSSDDPAGTDQFFGYDGSMEIRVVVA